MNLYSDPEPYPGEDLESQLRARFDSVIALRADTQKFTHADTSEASAFADAYDVSYCWPLFVRVSDRKGDIDLPADQVPLVDQIYKSGKPVITLGFGSPYLIERFPKAETWLSAFGISDVAQISMARALFGEIPISGHFACLHVPWSCISRQDSLCELPADPMRF